MKKVQSSKNQDRVIDELCKRYENRGTNYDRSPAYAEQKTREIATRAIAPKSYKISNDGAKHLHEYKNGVSKKGNYMTDGDFADYYKANREYTPESNAELDTVILLQRIDRARYKKENMKMHTEKNDIKAKLKAEAERSNPKGKSKQMKNTNSKTGKNVNALSKNAKIKEVAKTAAKTWIPIDERNKEKIVEGKKSKFPKGIVLAIALITMSLMLIIGSIVLLGSAKSEQNELKDEISLLDAEIAELKNDLDKKNIDADIEIFAKESLGMIKQEHVNAEYIKTNKTDGMSKDEENKMSFGLILDWIFQLFE